MEILSLEEKFNQYCKDQSYVVRDNSVIRGERSFFIVFLKDNQKIEYKKLGLKYSVDLVVISSKKQKIRNNAYWAITELRKENFVIYMLIRKIDISGKPLFDQGNLKCTHCNKNEGDHKAKTLNCPIGRRSSIGFNQYYENQFYTKKIKE
jgi:hypothetical protein